MMKKIIAIYTFLLGYTFMLNAQTGNLGIGTSTPGTKLDVNGAITNRETSVAVASNAATIPANTSQVQLTGSATATITITAPAAPNAGQRLIIYNNTTGGFEATLNGITVNNGQALEFVYSGAAWRSTNNGIANSNFWQLSGNSGTNTSTNFLGTTDNVGLRLRTNNLERLRITATGKVGIGVSTDPVIGLVLATGSSSTRTDMRIISPAGNSRIDLFADDGNAAQVISNSTNLVLGTNVNSPITFITNNITQATILGNGNTGIGTGSPTNTLHVNAASNPMRLQGLQAASATAYNTLVSDATGVLKLKNANSVSGVRATGSITFTVNNTVYFNNVTAAPTEQIDNLGEFSGNTFTALQDGLYQVSFIVNFDQRSSANDNGDGYLGGIQILAGTASGPPIYATTSGKISLPEAGGAAATNQVGMSDLVKLTAGQVIQFKAYVYGASGGNTAGYYISIARVD